MALTNTDKKEIERISRKEIKSFLKTAAFEKDVIDVVESQLKRKNTKLSKVHRAEVVDVSTKVLIELYRTFWLRRNFWDSQIKNVK
tara:strand:- start:5434 stop:5691 length:258 start_codon:yes stop_codon:yes gene_type:complete